MGTLAGGTLTVWWHLWPRLIAIYVTGWFGYQLSLRLGAMVSEDNAFVALFIVSAGFVSILAGTVICLTLIGRQLHVERIVPEARVTQPVSQQLAVTILPFLGIYATFDQIQAAADRLVTYGVLIKGFSDDSLLAALNPLRNFDSALTIIGVVVGAYVVRRVVDLIHDRTGIRILGLVAAFFEGFFMLMLFLSGQRLLTNLQFWLEERKFTEWLEVPQAGIAQIGQWLNINLPEILTTAWTVFAETVWPAALKAVGEPILWLAVAALVYGSGVLSFADLWRKGKPVGSALPLTRRQQRRAHLAEAKLAGSRGRARRVGLEIQEAFFGDIDDKYLPTFQSLRLVVKAGLTLLGAFVLLYSMLTLLANLLRRGIEIVVGGQDLVVWGGVELVSGLVVAAVQEPLRLALLAVTFRVVLDRYHASAAQSRLPALVPAGARA